MLVGLLYDGFCILLLGLLYDGFCILLVGLLYEMCVELCTARACKSDDNVTVNHPLAGTPCSDADLSLVSWLQKVPTGTFACPFEKKALKLKVNE